MQAVRRQQHEKMLSSKNTNLVQEAKNKREKKIGFNYVIEHDFMLDLKASRERDGARDPEKKEKTA